MNKNFELKKCNKALAKALNTEIFNLIPEKSSKVGLHIEVDQEKLVLAPNSELAKTILAMDPRILRFVLEEKQACR